MKTRLFLAFCALIGAGRLSAAGVEDQGGTPKPKQRVQDKLVTTLITKQGLTMNQAASCIIINQLPWKFRKTARQSRLLFRDKMRWNTQGEAFDLWEVQQVMDDKGYISYVFRRALPTGGYDAIVTKENIFNEILDVGGVKKTKDVRNLSNFVDRNALTFYTESGGRIVFQPGLSGQGRLSLYFDNSIPPIMLKGGDCRRSCVDGRDPYDIDCSNISLEDDQRSATPVSVGGGAGASSGGAAAGAAK